MGRKIAAGNWKMNGSRAALAEITALIDAHPSPNVETVICPPATLISFAADQAQGHDLTIGAQDCHASVTGPHTGDLSAYMIHEAGATHVILGHSERRADHGETSDMVLDKVKAARRVGLRPIVCAGEDLSERESGNAVEIVTEEVLASLPDDTDGSVVVAYEPIWAIGTGKTAELADIAEMHGAIRAALTDRFGAEIADEIKILYGGSVKPDNAADIFAVANVDGALVGGASLKAVDFSAIITALELA